MTPRIALSCVFLALVGGLYAEVPPTQASETAESVAESIVQPVGTPLIYKQAKGQALHLYVVKPAGWKPEDRRPAIVFFHGGGWTHGAPSSFNRFADYFSGRGMVSVLVEYRLVARKGRESPAVCIQDAKSAMRWVRSHAKNLGVDADRLAASGSSAGGHLAAFVGMMRGFDDPEDNLSVSCRPQAMLLIGPVIDNGPQGYAHGRVKPDYKAFSPYHNVKADAPPVLILSGEADTVVSVEMIRDFKKQMEAAGVRCELHTYPEQKHGFAAQGRYHREALGRMDSFLVSLGWLAAP